MSLMHTLGCQIGDNTIKMLNITSNFLICKYQTDDVQYFIGRYTKFVGDLIYKPPIGLGCHGTKIFK